MADATASISGTCHCGKCSWRLLGDPGSITACNCTLCRRYGALWAYGHEGETVTVTGPTSSYRRAELEKPYLETLFCPTCACVLAWRGLEQEDDGRRRMAVNVRLAAPEAVLDLRIDQFDGLDAFEDLPPTGRCVRDLWF
jgi:hypothetical protein